MGLCEFFTLLFFLKDLKRNDYTPDKVILPQDEHTASSTDPDDSTKESKHSIRLML